MIAQVYRQALVAKDLLFGAEYGICEFWMESMQDLCASGIGWGNQRDVQCFVSIRRPLKSRDELA